MARLSIAIESDNTRTPPLAGLGSTGQVTGGGGASSVRTVWRVTRLPNEKYGLSYLL